MTVFQLRLVNIETMVRRDQEAAMFRRSREPEVVRADVVAMTAVIRQIDPCARQALYAAANGGSLRRRTWDGCALNRAAEVVGMRAKSKAEASSALGIPRDVVGDFLAAWDRLRGSDRECTAILRDAILEAGLFEDAPEGEAAPEPTADDLVADAPVEAEQWTPAR